MSDFGSIYLDKEKDIVVRLEMEQSALRYTISVRNHQSNNLINNLAAAAGQKTTVQNGKTVMAIRKYGKGKIIAALEMPHLENAGACLLEYDYGKGI